MINLLANDIKFCFPQMWSEITWKQWKQIEASTDLKHIASVLSGLEVNDQMLQQLMPFMTFMQLPFVPEDWKIPGSVSFGGKDVKIDFSIKKHTYGQKLIAQTLKPDEMPMIIAIYFQPIVDQCPFDYDKALLHLQNVDNLLMCDVFSISKFIISQVNAALKTESIELAFNPSSEQVRAGIDMFNQFGSMNTLDALAGGDILKYEQILLLPYNSVFLKLKMLNVQSKFKRNYEKIIKEKK